MTGRVVSVTCRRRAFPWKEGGESDVILASALKGMLSEIPRGSGPRASSEMEQGLLVPGPGFRLPAIPSLP